jgi:tetratricopeptide (TPR) repeat protein
MCEPGSRGPYVEKGDLASARTFLTEETAAQHPELWLTLAEIELSGHRLDKGRAAVVRALSLGADQREAALELADRLVTVSPDGAYQCIDALVEEALAEKDYPRAAAAIGRLTARVPNHIVALVRLVEVAVDGKLEGTMYDAQAQLAAAYLHAGRRLEARIISEDLIARRQSNVADVERFRKALVLPGENDPEAIIADRLNSQSPFRATEQIDFNEGADPSISSSPTASASSISDRAPWLDEGEHDSTLAEIDLTEQLFGDTPPRRARGRGAWITFFQGLREEMDRTPDEEGAAEQYRLALRYREMGLLDETITALEGAARSPRQRFDAASMLGRLHLEGGRTAKAVKWFERAAEAPAPTPDAGRALRYDLAHTFEAEGEHRRALALFLALDSEMAGYRDVSERIERLSRAQARG